MNKLLIIPLVCASAPFSKKNGASLSQKRLFSRVIIYSDYFFTQAIIYAIRINTVPLDTVVYTSSRVITTPERSLLNFK